MPRDKVQTKVHGLSEAAKARILREMKLGDQARIAEALDVDASYVKKILRYRPQAKSVCARLIWKAADQLIRDRARLNDLRP